MVTNLSIVALVVQFIVALWGIWHLRGVLIVKSKIAMRFVLIALLTSFDFIGLWLMFPHYVIMFSQGIIILLAGLTIGDTPLCYYRRLFLIGLLITISLLALTILIL